MILGNGTPQHAQWFAEDFDISTPLFTDPEKKTYDAVGARRGLASSFNPRTIVAALKARRGGFRQTKTMGDSSQQGGVFVITPAGEMPYRYVSKFAGDHPAPEEPVSVIEGLPHTR